ncbi:hypothetical protein [Arthrobacter sp. UYCu723]
MKVLAHAETTLSIDVVAQDRESMDRGLNAAVEQMTEVAVRLATHGILVTRLDDRLFRVGLSELVPFGYTEQRDCRT